MKRPTKGADGSTRVRFIMLEAESESGDLAEIAAAIQNALRPKSTVEQRTVYVEDKGEARLELAPAADLIEEADEPAVAAKRARPAPQRRSFPTPQVVDVEWDVKPSIEEFAASHSAKTVSDRFLVVLAWQKEAAKKTAVSVDEVYTVFRKLGWPTNIKDFSQPLRDLKSQQWVTGGAKDGFSINHLGLDRVKKFGEGK
jgi:hypothetical protein